MRLSHADPCRERLPGITLLMTQTRICAVMASGCRTARSRTVSCREADHLFVGANRLFEVYGPNRNQQRKPPTERLKAIVR
jgi:hypothetical protein